jgi:transposase
VFFQDEARIGQKGRVCHRWHTKGVRPPGLADNRFTFTYIFGCCALVLPEVSTVAMQVFLDEFAKTIADDEHVLMFLDSAGWHVANALKVPKNITLQKIPPYSPELNPVERVWLYLKERFLSHRLHGDYPDIVEAICKAWNRLTASPGRLSTLTNYGWRPTDTETVIG